MDNLKVKTSIFVKQKSYPYSESILMIKIFENYFKYKEKLYENNIHVQKEYSFLFFFAIGTPDKVKHNLKIDLNRHTQSMPWSLHCSPIVLFFFLYPNFILKHFCLCI